MADHGLGLLLVRGALRAPFKRPSPERDFPRSPLVRPVPRIDLARLAAYERVCGFPTGDSALPLTYPHVLGFPLAMRLMSDRAFPLPLPGLVHTSIEIVRHAPLPASGGHELAVHIDGLAPHRRGTEATVATVMRADGGVVWESRSTYLARHHTDRSAEPRDARPCRPRSVPLPVVAEWRLAGDIGRRYGAVSGDRNPIHLHPFTARLFGFPRAIAHGMWTVARCLAAGDSGGTRVSVRFLAPVLLPGVVAYGADGSGRFELRGDGGRLHLLGEVS
ncbi:MaoC/PaaZ C-terminal domain-containing protein [Streptomyces sp. NPDC001817]|uniref:MaoC/PaaZ C-terminal domain-containing protein n=1 Tax=Streptomyces sp. NPDC001817 TaxID=3154398 RepID=UPI00331F38A6